MLSERLIISNDLTELRRMSAWLKRCCGVAEIPDDVVFSLDLCANEAVTNIICYAFDGVGRHNIILEFSDSVRGASLTITDDGMPFNMLEAPEHKQPSSLAEAKIGGLGIHLIRHLVSQCHYQRAGGQNVFSFEVEHNPHPGNA